MNWIYSIVFAGLLFSSNEQPAARPHYAGVEAPADSVVVLDEVEKFEQSYPLSRTGNVSVSNVNGSIVVEAWDRDEVRLEATKIADTKEGLADVELKINSSSDSFSVEAEYPSWKWSDKGKDNRGNRRLEVQFRLSVPRTAVLNEIETVNGSVTVSNFTSVTKVSAVNGNVLATNLRGTASLSTVNGEVRGEFDQVDPGSKINLNTVNGKASLVLPSDASATLKADSLNGNITNDFGLPVRKGRYVGRDMYGRIGNGDGQIKLSSVNGELTISRKNDGRSVSPSTNLLNKKADEDWDSEDERMSRVRSERVDREVSRAIRESQRETAEAVREAQKAMEAIPVVLESLKIEELEKLEKIKVIDEKKLEKQLKEEMRNLDQLNKMIGFQTNPSVQKKRNAFRFKGVPRVNVDTRGCSLTLRGWDKDSVEYVVTEVSGRVTTPPIVTDYHDNSSVTIKVANSSRAPFELYSNPDRVRVEVFVPRKSNVKISSDAEIRVEGVSGDIELRGGNESINVRDVDGKMTLVANEALVRVIGFQGELTSQTKCGDVFLEGDFKKLNAKATDGTVTLTVPDNADATLTSNTQIESDGVEVVHEGEKTWRLGKGGLNYNFDFNDGKLVVRSSSTVNTK